MGDDSSKAVRQLAAAALDQRQVAVDSAFMPVIKALRSGEDPDQEELKTLREELAHSGDLVDQYLRQRAEER